MAQTRMMRNLVFGAAAIIAAAAYLFAFAFRYMWYLQPQDTRVLIACYAVVMASVLALWAFFPSRLAVGVIALAGLVFPPVYDGNTFARIDWRFGLLALFHVGLLVGATHLRQVARRAPGQ